MRKIIRMTALLLCLILTIGIVFSVGPVSSPAFAAETEPRDAEPVEITEAAEPALSTEATEPMVTAEPNEPEPTEPTDPEPTDPEPTDPEPTDPEPTDPEPTDPEPTDPEPTDPEPTDPEPTDPTEPPEPPVSEMTDEQIIAKYNIPDDWARSALIFAVRNGILAGKGNNDLAPRDNTTHAELATMLISILKTDKMASLSKYTDVKSSSWYYDWMAKAVSLGIFPIADPNATTLTPNVKITREEAFVALARMFGVHGQGRQTIYQFSDWKDVSDWAADDISAMIDAGCIAGNQGRILPQDNITRRELVQVLSRLLTKVGTEMPSQDFTGQMGLGASTVPANTTIHGDLLLSTDATSITLNGLTVTGRLILQGNGTVTIQLNSSSIHELVLCRDARVCSDSPLNAVTTYASLKLYGSADTVNVYGTLILKEGFTVKTVNAYYDVGITNNGTINTLNVLGDSVYINGSGLIKTLNLKAEELTNRCNTNNTVEIPHNTVDSITATRTNSNKATEASPSVKMTLKLQNMPEGWSECDLKWYVNSEYAASSTRNLLKEGSTISQTYNFSKFLDGFHTEVLFTVYITVNGKQRLLYKGYVNVEEPVASIAQNIRTQNVQAVVNCTTGLYSSYTLSTDTYSGLIMNLQKGTQVTVLEVRDLKAARVRLENGQTGWMNTYHKDTIQINYYITTDYSTAVKEYYVNNVRKWTSSTNYMIWVSLWTQRFNVFQKVSGKWKLVHTGLIGSGTNYNPTPVEDVKLLYHSAQWTYDVFYVHHVTVFDSYRGFHSVPTKYDSDGGGIYDGTLGRPASHGCIRVSPDDAVYIYNLPLNTAVHIY